MAVVVAAVGIVVGALVAVPLPLRTAGAASPEGEVVTDELVLGDPILYGPTAAIPGEDRFVGFDLRDGAQRWASDECLAAEEAAPVGSRQGQILVVSCGGELRGLDLQTGRFLWAYEPDRDWTMLRVGGGRVAVGLGDHADVLDLVDGERLIRWTGRDVDEESITVALSEDLVFFGEDERVFAVEDDGAVRWEADTIPSAMWAADGMLLTRYVKEFRRFDLVSGEELETFFLGGSTPNSMIVGDDRGVAVLAKSDETEAVFGVGIWDRSRSWAGDGKRFLAVGPAHVAVLDAGRCQVLRIDTGATVASCGDGWDVGLDGDRVAFVASARRGGAGSRIVVRSLPPAD